MQSAASSHDAVLLPVHVRHHWASAVLTRSSDKRLNITVYDSCRSSATASDMRAVFKRMQLLPDKASLTVMSHGKQRRDSVECGLHVILIAIALCRGDLPTKEPHPVPRSNLDPWRTILRPVTTGAASLTPCIVDQLINAAPETCALVGIHLQQANDDPITGAGSTSKSNPLKVIATTTVATQPAPKRRALPAPPPLVEAIDVDDTDSQPDASQYDLNCFPLPRGKILDAAPTAFRENLSVWFAADSTPRTPNLQSFPPGLGDQPELIEPLRLLADREMRREIESNKRRDRLELLHVGLPGTQLITNMVDHLGEQLASHPRIQPNWTYVTSSTLRLALSRPERASDHTIATGKDVLAVAWEQLAGTGHFIALYFTQECIHVVDSLISAADEASSWPRATTAHIIDAFAMVLRANKRKVKKSVSLMSSHKQFNNDCGIFAINNLVRASTGQDGLLTRTQFATAYASQADPFSWDFSIVPEQGKHDGRTKPPVFNPQPCCRNPTIDPDQLFCEVHHPLNVARPDRARCTRIANYSKERCQRDALEIGGVDWTCRMHSTAEERECVTLALQLVDVSDRVSELRKQHEATKAPPIPPKRPAAKTFTHKPYDAPVLATVAPSPAGPSAAISVGNAKTPLSARYIAHAVATAPADRSYEVVSKDGPERPARWRGRVVSSTRFDVVLLVTHAFCHRCDEWHAKDDEETRVVPSPNTQYFQVTHNDAPPTECWPDCDEDHLGSDEDDDDDMLLPTSRFDDEKEPLFADLPEGYHSETLLRQAASWQWRPQSSENPDRKPAGVHRLTWRLYASATRKAHRKYLTLIHQAAQDPAWSAKPMGKAIVELIMALGKRNDWRWTTYACTFSTVATALKQLEMYTFAKGIPIKEDLYFDMARERVKQNAAQTQLRPSKSAPLSEEDFHRLASDLSGNAEARMLLVLTWHLAGRIGEVRRIQPDNFVFRDRVEEGTDAVPFSVTYTEGKGIRYCGIYTVHTTLPVPEAKRLREHLATKQRHQHAFAIKDQAAVSRVVNGIPDHSVRSLRRGALVHLAKCGVPDVHLQNLSGHKRKSTLMRYLGWGVESSEAADSARLRAQMAARHAPAGSGFGPRGGGSHYDGKRFPMNMGTHSGYAGDHRGRRTEPPPSLFSYQPPSNAALGLSTRDAHPEWDLHAKRVRLLDLEGIAEQVQATDLKQYMQACVEWTTTDTHYGITWDHHVAKQVPTSNFTPAQFATLLEFDKIAPLDASSPIRCGVKGFTVPQPAKQRHRPVFEPLNNQVIDFDMVPPIKYPSRLERRCSIADKTYFAQFDWAAYFDQFELAPEVRNCFVIRAKSPIEWQGQEHTLFTLTREPMGATHAAQVAQTTTWAIIEPLLELNVSIVTMIDNVAIASDNPEHFVRAVQLFSARSEAFNTTLNEEDDIPSDPEAILQWGRKGSIGPTTFLGEVFSNGRVCNAPRNVEKFRMAYERVRDSSSDDSIHVTRRQLAAVIGLALWMAHTLQIQMAHHYELIRAFGAVEARRTGWDDRISVSTAALNALAAIAGPLLHNVPVRPRPIPEALGDWSSFDTVIVVDASSDGFGAFIHHDGTTCEYSEGWRSKLLHSAWAEPLAATCVLQFVRKRIANPGRIAIVTDHIALAKGQRRPLSGNGGFSRSFYLNQFFMELYRDDGDHQVFYIRGSENPADKPSRDLTLQRPARWFRVDNRPLPAMHSLHHPYYGRQVTRRPWQV